MTDPVRTHCGDPTPPRFHRPDALSFALYVGVLAFVVWCFDGAEMSLNELIEGLPNMGRMIREMFPPAFGRMDSIGATMMETFQMAVVGTVLGVAISLPLAVLAARNQTPNRILYYIARAAITFARTVPDLIWAIFFVITVGLGPFAGVLALTVDTFGFCARFFAESMEEVDPGPQEALTALGAGGIGIELKAAMDMFDYNEAATIILSIFALVVVVERVSAALRARLI